MSQGGEELELSCLDKNDRNISGMSVDFQNGMAFALSNWSSGNLDWLQGGKCQGSCSNPTLNFYNLEFNTANAPDVPDVDPVDPVDPNDLDEDAYGWGTQCALHDDGLCGDNCQGECRWSWPKDDQETCMSLAAACRCHSYNDVDYMFIRLGLFLFLLPMTLCRPYQLCSVA